ncbi:2,3-bisphosphoglycerate-independent phosphoglycerate mutase [Candidatus Dojkabacteria bacterium]|nr:2,3-bisphosphoglycerate-independent phosphoglycerate mutase [Candidatus Dojkabacteria bacterium]
MNEKRKVLLIIMDGLGAAPANNGNAVVLSNPQNLSSLWTTCPHTYLLASGEPVGLPKDVKGNSEVGHMNIGGGMVVTQTLPRIDKSIDTGLFFNNKILKEALLYAQKNNSRVHLLALASEGGVHSHLKHINSTIQFFSKNGFSNDLFVHAFTDGRDSSVNDATRNLDLIQKCIDENGLGQIATLCGRAWAMDRNKKWERTKVTYDLLTANIGDTCNSYSQCLLNSYSKNITDEFIRPTVLVKDSYIKGNDVVLFLNFRPDRALQLSQALYEKGFNKFPTRDLSRILFVGMVEYKKGFPQKVLFPKQYIAMPLGNIISTYGLRQLRIAESEKFPHVTYFFNGGTAIKYLGEDRIEVPSPSVPTYDTQPEMNALKLTDILINRFSNNIYDFIVVNFANPDMVGHTGNIQATIKAVSTVDYCVNRLVKEFTARDGVVVITSDHGNAEELINIDTNEMDTEHSYNPVPLIIAGLPLSTNRLKYGSLKDIAPTILKIMGYPIPAEMTGLPLLLSAY